MLYLLLYSRSELYSRAEAMYLTVGPTGDIFLVITRYIYLNNIECYIRYNRILIDTVIFIPLQPTKPQILLI